MTWLGGGWTVFGGQYWEFLKNGGNNDDKVFGGTVFEGGLVLFFTVVLETIKEFMG